ncbi:MAG: hypothetical protein R3211_02195, partial [Balneolaceae bacterium]|nr:hypothetical protein [Balneolaceae bacterium]
QAPPVGEATDDERITARITYRFQQVTTLFYKIGDATTGLTINDLSIEKSEEKVLLLADLTRTGNAPYIGTIDLTVTDQNGEVMARRRSSTSIYFDYIQSFSINKSDLPPGSYTATFSFETKRPDIAREDLVQAEPITRSTTFTIK